MTIPISKRTLKQSGIFEAPPQMVEAIFHWARETYCSYMLYKIEVERQTLLRPTYVKYNTTNCSNCRHGVSPDDATCKECGEEIVQGYTRQPGGEADDNQIVELGLMKQECMKYADRMFGGNIATKEFVINFQGSRYIDQAHPGSIINPIGDRAKIKVEINLGDNFTFGGWWNRYAKNPNDIHSFGELVLNVNDTAKSLHSLKYEIERTFRTIRHELQHLGQAYFFMMTESNLLSRKEFEAGMPSKNIQNLDRYRMQKTYEISRKIWSVKKDKNLTEEEKKKKIDILTKEMEKLPEVPDKLPKDIAEPTRLLHDLRDEEFYTDLADNIAKLRIKLLLTPKKYRREAIKTFIEPEHSFEMGPGPYDNKMRDMLKLYDLRSHSPFFAALLKHEPKKYRKAVIELLKAVADDFNSNYEGVDITDIPLPSGKTKIFGKTVAQYTQERGHELLGAPPPSQRQNWNVDQFLAPALKEYDDFINSLTPQQLLAHKKAVEASGLGYEYYVTDRWRQFDGVKGSSIPEPQRDEKDKTIVRPHPKLPKKS